MHRYIIRYRSYRKTQIAIVVQPDPKAAVAKFGKYYDPNRIVNISIDGNLIAKEHWE